MGRTDFAYDFRHRRLISAGALNPLDVQLIFSRAQTHFERNRTRSKKIDTLKGLTQLNLFFEPSTRTRASFEIAGKRLGADVINFSEAGASTVKGERFADTLAALTALNPDILVIRHSAAGAADFLAARTSAAVINAGDGAREHPTQALLDAFTLTRRWGEVGGKRIVIVGDILHSRVARSNVSLLNLLNAEVRLCGPPALLPENAGAWGAEVFTDLDKALDGCDAVMALRLQRERMGGALIGSDLEYFRRYGLTAERLRRVAPKALILHPGPVNRGVEIESALADDRERSLILDQVEAGLAVRMAVLELLSETAPNMTWREARP